MQLLTNRAMGKRLYTIFLFLLAAAVCFALGACVVFNQIRFGKPPQGDRLDRIQGSPNFRDGQFQYPMSTPKFSKDVSLFSVIWSVYFDKNEWLVPNKPIPAVKTDLKALVPRTDTVVWLGHSSWFVQLGGNRILVDPVFSDHAAANHPWDEPFKHLIEASQDKPYRLLTPRIGEPVNLDDNEKPVKNEENGLILSDMQVKISAMGHTATFRLYDTAAAKEFYAQLPLKLDLTNFRDAQISRTHPKCVEYLNACDSIPGIYPIFNMKA